MKYQMREQMFAIGDDYWIETGGGRPAFKVDGKALRIRKTLILQAPEGDELLTIRKKLLSIRNTMEIEREGETVATVRKALVTPLRDRFSIEVEGGEDMEAKGNRRLDGARTTGRCRACEVRRLPNGASGSCRERTGA